DYKAETTKFETRDRFAPSTPAAVKERVIGQATSAPPEIALAALSAVLTYDPIPALRQTRAPIRAIDSDLTPIDLEANRKYAPQFDAAIMTGAGHTPMLEAPARRTRA